MKLTVLLPNDSPPLVFQWFFHIFKWCFYIFLSLESLILDSVYWFPIMVDEDFTLYLIYLAHLGKILFTAKSRSVYSDHASFLVQLCFLKLIIASLMFRIFVCLLVFKHLLLHLPTPFYSTVFLKVRPFREAI